MIDASKTKRNTDDELKGEGESSKKLTKRATDKVKDLTTSKKKRAIDSNLKLEREIEAFKKRLEEEQKTALAHQRQLDEHSNDITTLKAENGALNKRLLAEQEATFTEQRRAMEQIAALQAEHKILGDGHEHAQALANGKEQQVREITTERDTLGEQRALTAEKAAAQAQQAEFSIEEAEDEVIEMRENLFKAKALAQAAQGKAVQLETQVAELNATAEATGKELQEANSKIAQLNSALEDEEESSACLGEENEKLEAQLTESQAIVAQLQTTLDSKESNEHKNIECDELRIVND